VRGEKKSWILGETVADTIERFIEKDRLAVEAVKRAEEREIQTSTTRA